MPLVGDLKDNTLTGIDGPDQENDIRGDALTMEDHSKGGKDILIGGANAFNVLCGDTGDLNSTIDKGDMDHSKGGDDTVTGGANADNILVGDAHTMIDSKGGDDTLTGGANADDILVGDAHTMIDSEGGNDRLVSGANATDQMWGDAEFADNTSKGGKDTFAFSTGNGNDEIFDFQHGKDIIELDGFSCRTSFNNLNIQTVDGNSVIHFDPTDSITVHGVNLTESDFLFVA